jgi:hypothetical protein
MSKGKIVGVVFFVIFMIGAVYMVGNSFKGIEEAQQWVAYEYGECVYNTGDVEGCDLENSKEMYEKYYGDNGVWVYGENPRLGYEIESK